MRKIILVSGMHCEHCKKRVETAVNSIEEAKAVVDLKSHSVEVTSKADIEDEVLLEAITQAGYTVTSIERKQESFFRNPFRKS